MDSSPSLLSFATQNFGKKTSDNTTAPVSAPLLHNLIDLSRPSDATYDIIEEILPSRKRHSIDAPEGAQPSALKRLKEVNYANKENISTTSSSSSKGKRSAVPQQWTPGVPTGVDAPNNTDVSSRPNPFVVSLSSKPSYADPGTQLNKNSDLDSVRSFTSQILFVILAFYFEAIARLFGTDTWPKPPTSPATSDINIGAWTQYVGYT